MASGFTWYRRLGDIPGVGYATPPGVNRFKLRGASAKPKVSRFGFEGRQRLSAEWPGGGSASPASQHMRTDKDGPLTEVLHRLHEALELPGTASDYHYALMETYQALYSRRREEALALVEVERLCWLDIALVERCPRDRGEEFDLREVDHPAFSRLMQIYEREGYLLEARSVAERAAGFMRPNPANSDREDPRQYYLERAAAISQRIAAIEEWDAG